ncbi:MAG: FtsX-like permease family protein [Verrucomicrobia bacterium]|jgi:putative ABC transport system permease protein|nr:FtsX-like permease family protein [Verrucomicrobiota bacterium]MBT7064890.1 FtsX-like permease family protein [Verrucomicrobiota bacterium]MBT7702298.1 FtsX-like permease family protein [Verrucomicrobiota bacterium]
MTDNSSSANEARQADSRVLTCLPFGDIFAIAVKGLRIRIWRATLVISGIVLAVAFLTYILCGDGLLRGAATYGSADLIERLTQDGLIDQTDAADQRVQTFWIVGLATLISFVGIVNAMLMSVTERFREIGTMKCLGALNRFVLRLFLIESALEGAVGTGLGVLLGLAIGFGEGLTLYGGEVWALFPASRFLTMVAACFVGGVTLTILGALYPAAQAAKMSPVEALRTEV